MSANGCWLISTGLTISYTCSPHNGRIRANGDHREAASRSSENGRGAGPLTGSPLVPATSSPLGVSTRA